MRMKFDVVVLPMKPAEEGVEKRIACDHQLCAVSQWSQNEGGTCT